MAETAAAHAPHGAVEHHEGPSYVAVFVYLTLLTAAELGVYGLGLPKAVMVGALVALALAKAALVAMFFMHLAMERKGLWVVAVVPLVIIAFCYFMLRPDLSRRSWASHQEDVVIGHHEQPSEVLPEVPQGKSLEHADEPADTQVGQPKPAAPAPPVPQP
jgi:cytochrome c oxidase subunit 4